MSSKVSQYGARWAPPIAWAIVIFLLSSFSTLPGPSLVWWDFVLKKTAHMTEFGILFFLIQRSLNWRTSKPRYWPAFLLTVLYALSDEYHQSFTPGRTPLITDVGYDSLGSFLVYLKLTHNI